MTAETESQAKEPIGPRPPWKAKSVWAALVVMLLGGGLWIADGAKPAEQSAARPPGLTQFSGSSTAGMEAEAQGSATVQPSSPAIFRFGASYLGGFFLGWLFRRFLKLSMLLAGAAVVLIAVASKLGWFEVDWAALEGHLRHSLAWLQGEAEAFRQFLTGYLPSVGAAGVGAFLGFRRK